MTSSFGDILALLGVVSFLCALAVPAGYLATKLNKPRHEWLADKAFRIPREKR